MPRMRLVFDYSMHGFSDIPYCVGCDASRDAMHRLQFQGSKATIEATPLIGQCLVLVVGCVNYANLRFLTDLREDSALRTRQTLKIFFAKIRAAWAVLV
jgi:hypothetical protein